MKGLVEAGIAKLLQEGRDALAQGTSLAVVESRVSGAVESVEALRQVMAARSAAVLRGNPQVATSLEDVERSSLRLLLAIQNVPTVAREAAPPAEGVRHPLADHLDAIEDAHTDMLAALDLLRGLQAAEESFSPFPTLNLAIKVGINVHDGHLEPEALDPWIERAWEVAERLRSRVERFSHLHQEGSEGLVSCARSLVEDLQAGIGAWTLFRRQEAGSEALLDGLRLLKHPSERLALALEAMDAHARKTASWSVMPALEELWRAAHLDAQGRLPREQLTDVRESVSMLAHFHMGQASALEAVPLSAFVEDELRMLRDACGQLQEVLAPSLSSLDEASLWRLRQAFTDVVAAHDEVLRRLEEEAARVSPSPQLEELKELAGRVVRGTTTVEFFRERLVFYLKGHARLEMEVRQAAREVGGDANLLLKLLHEQGEGLEVVTRFFRDGDSTHLIEGFHLMEEALPALVEAKDRVVGAVRQAVPETRTVQCFKCSTANVAGSKYCKQCNTLLPAISLDMTEEEEVLEDLAPLPSNLRRLELLMKRFETDPSCIWEIEYAAGLYLDRLFTIRRDFETRCIPRLRAEGSRTLLILGRDFYENLTTLQQGLVTMLGYREHGRADVMYRGFYEVAQTGRNMRRAQERIEEALRER